MSLSISGIAPVQPAYTSAPTPAATQQAAQPAASADTVKLSQSAQVNQLNTQGRSPSQIAETLGIPIATVNSDLGIVAAKVGSAPARAPAATAPVTPTQPAPASAATITKSASTA